MRRLFLLSLGEQRECNEDDGLLGGLYPCRVEYVENFRCSLDTRTNISLKKARWTDYPPCRNNNFPSHRTAYDEGS